MKQSNELARGRNAWQGMNWIRQEKRLAIYMRDGLACVYCNATNDQTSFTLDHIVTHIDGGTNHESNLVTCCLTCNSSRGARKVRSFVKAFATYRNIDANTILAHIKATTKRSLDVKAAKALIARRGSAAKVISK